MQCDRDRMHCDRFEESERSDGDGEFRIEKVDGRFSFQFFLKEKKRVFRDGATGTITGTKGYLLCTV